MLWVWITQWFVYAPLIALLFSFLCLTHIPWVQFKRFYWANVGAPMPSFNSLGTKIRTPWVCILLQNQEPKKLFIIDTTNGIYLGVNQEHPCCYMHLWFHSMLYCILGVQLKMFENQNIVVHKTRFENSVFFAMKMTQLCHIVHLNGKFI